MLVGFLTHKGDQGTSASLARRHLISLHRAGQESSAGVLELTQRPGRLASVPFPHLSFFPSLISLSMQALSSVKQSKKLVILSIRMVILFSKTTFYKTNKPNNAYSFNLLDLEEARQEREVF